MRSESAQAPEGGAAEDSPLDDGLARPPTSGAGAGGEESPSTNTASLHLAALIERFFAESQGGDGGHEQGSRAVLGELLTSLRSSSAQDRSSGTRSEGIAESSSPLDSLDSWLARGLVRIANAGESDPSVHHSPGDSILRRFGRYIVLGVLGEGGMGVVYKGYDDDLDRQVALKVLHSDPIGRHGPRLKREAQALARLAHPNVVQVYEVGEAEGKLFVAMELVNGKTLRRWQNDPGGPRGWKECVGVYLQAGRGLAAAHAKGLVHRDFKPDNAILDEDGRARVLDFGLARRSDEGSADLGESAAGSIEKAKSERLSTAPLDASLTRTGSVLGTPAYMPLEQMKGEEADARSDQFSFCASLYEAVYGERPYEESSMSARMRAMLEGAVRPAPKGSRVPIKLRDTLLRGLSGDPQRRWPSMEQLLHELQALVAPRASRIIAGVGLALAALAGLGALYLGGELTEKTAVIDEQEGKLTEKEAQLQQRVEELEYQTQRAERAKTEAELAQARAEQAKTRAEKTQKENERSVRQMFEVALRPLTERMIEDRETVGVIEADERWTPLLQRTNRTLVAASLGEGFRVVVAGHESVLSEANSGGRPLFLENTTRWLLADQARRTVAIVTSRAEGHALVQSIQRNLIRLEHEFELDPSLTGPSALAEVGMLILHDLRELGVDERASIERFMGRGGGVLAVGNGRDWLSSGSPGGGRGSAMDDYPMNLVLGNLGVRWTDATVSSEELERRDVPAVVRFDNELGVEVDLYTRSVEHEEYYTTLEPGGSRDLLTAIGREWIMRATADGREIDTMAIEDEEQIVTIGATSVRTRTKPRAAPPPEEPEPEPSRRAPARLPETLSDEDMQTALGDAKKAGKRCGQELRTLMSEATVRLEVGASGKVERVAVLPPAKGSSEAACIETAVSGLSFPRTRQGGRATWTLKLY